MEMRSNGFIFLCGKNDPRDGDQAPCTKNVLLASLATNWAVRTHYEPDVEDPRSDRGTLFRNVASSHVFLFIFSQETTMNAFYLNQLGMAFARGVPIVGIREPSYIMPNPLPEHYYSTEIVNLSDNRPNDHRSRPSSRGKWILSNLLIDSFRNAVVYTPDFHKSCLERLFRKVTDAFAKSQKERCVPASVAVGDYNKSGEAVRQKVWTCNSGLTKCSKCGTAVKATRKTSILRKTNSVDNLLNNDSLQPSSWHQVDAPQLVITKSVLQPVVTQPNFSKAVFQAISRRPATSVIRKSSSAKVTSSETRHVHESRPTSSKSCNAIPGSNSRLKEVKPEMVENVQAGPGIVTQMTHDNGQHFVRRKTSTTGYITSKRGALLRKMSSLPCIPTTYLVADPANEEPALVKYPPDGAQLSTGATDVPEFTDDEDKETIHISRRPSPSISICSTNIE